MKIVKYQVFGLELLESSNTFVADITISRFKLSVNKAPDIPDLTTNTRQQELGMLLRIVLSRTLWRRPKHLQAYLFQDR